VFKVIVVIFSEVNVSQQWLLPIATVCPNKDFFILLQHCIPAVTWFLLTTVTSGHVSWLVCRKNAAGMDGSTIIHSH
jgi:hypothetical protein